MKALVLSGGGSKGAYQAGAVQYLMGHLGRDYDIFSGTSVGALNAAFLAQFTTAQRKQAGTQLFDLWKHMSADKVYREWYHGALSFLPALWKGSVYTSAPLKKLLDDNFDETRIFTSGKILTVSAVCETTAEGGIWRETDDDIMAGVLASSAFPGVLPAVEARGQLWIDGGCRDGTPLRDAIVAGATEVDVILCTGNGMGPTKDDVLSKVLRAVDVLLDEIERADLDAAEKWNLLVRAGLAPKDKREVAVRILRISHSPAKHAFDFRPEVISELLVQGYEDAMAFAETHKF